MLAWDGITILTIGESWTQKGLWPLGRGKGKAQADGAEGDCGHHDICITSTVKGWFGPSMTQVNDHAGGPKLQLKWVV